LKPGFLKSALSEQKSHFRLIDPIQQRQIHAKSAGVCLAIHHLCQHPNFACVELQKATDFQDFIQLEVHIVAG